MSMHTAGDFWVHGLTKFPKMSGKFEKAQGTRVPGKYLVKECKIS
jgi:hypothetical protein